jgi:hypothetical protein
MGLYAGTTMVRDAVLAPGVALHRVAVTASKDCVVDVGLARNKQETIAWAYMIAHGVSFRAGETKTFTASGAASAASAFTRYLRVVGPIVPVSAVLCFVDASGVCAENPAARAAYDAVETEIEVYGDADQSTRVYAVQSGSRAYYAQLVDANDPNRAVVSASAGTSVPSLSVNATGSGVVVQADEATFPNVPETTTLTIALEGTAVTLEHGRPIYAKRDATKKEAVRLFDEHGAVNLDAIGAPGSIVVETRAGTRVSVSRVSYGPTGPAGLFGPVPADATRLVAIAGVDAEICPDETIEAVVKADGARVVAYTGSQCTVEMYAGSTRLEPATTTARWYPGPGGAIEVVARASGASALVLDAGAPTGLLYVEVDGVVASYTDGAKVSFDSDEEKYYVVTPHSARVPCELVEMRENDADVTVSWPWAPWNSLGSVTPGLVSPESLASLTSPTPAAMTAPLVTSTATATAYSCDDGPFRATVRADATHVRVRLSDGAELDAVAAGGALGKLTIDEWVDGARFRATIAVASIADPETELVVLGYTDVWDVHASIENAESGSIVLVGAKQGTETLDIVESADTVVSLGTSGSSDPEGPSGLTGLTALTMDETQPMYYKFVTVSASSIGCIAIYGAREAASKTLNVTGLRATQTRLTGSVSLHSLYP